MAGGAPYYDVIAESNRMEFLGGNDALAVGTECRGNGQSFVSFQHRKAMSRPGVPNPCVDAPSESTQTLGSFTRAIESLLSESESFGLLNYFRHRAYSMFSSLSASRAE
jgi:hypothetical protein